MCQLDWERSIAWEAVAAERSTDSAHEHMTRLSLEEEEEEDTHDATEVLSAGEFLLHTV